MDLNETIQFTRIIDNLGRLWPKLTGMAATEAVNFFKERFVAQVDINNKPFAKRTVNKKKSDNGRAILVKRGVLKRDIQKVYANEYSALISTSRLTQPYAKANNEGFEGTVTVPQHTRARYKKVRERYTTKKGNERTRTSKQVDESKGSITVRTHTRKMKVEQRQFMGASPLLDRRIDYMLLSQITQTIKNS